jgi:hypothetical protein
MPDLYAVTPCAPASHVWSLPSSRRRPSSTPAYHPRANAAQGTQGSADATDRQSCAVPLDAPQSPRSRQGRRGGSPGSPVDVERMQVNAVLHVEVPLDVTRMGGVMLVAPPPVLGPLRLAHPTPRPSQSGHGSSNHPGSGPSAWPVESHRLHNSGRWAQSPNGWGGEQNRQLLTRRTGRTPGRRSR